ncbi:hypothetical protein OAD36_04745 [Gammaproteobacteria bacterium]|nr:hypothetical protein [Gammaproteobacteria bacterium]
MSKIGIVCHDAGGSEILSHWIADSSGHSFLHCLSGPAETIFKKNLGWSNSVSISQLADECDWLLCGTSWKSELETSAIKKFKIRGKKTIAFLDHWVNYEERFRHGNDQVLPDEIWVGDEYAKNIAVRCFSNIPVFLKNNPYFTKIEQDFAFDDNDLESKNVVLYVCEPIKEHALLQEGNERHWGYTEEDALEYFLDNISYIKKEIESVVIRPHPSERLDKYNWALDRTNLSITIGGQRTLAQEISTSSIVIGCESMAMVVGLLAGKKIISSIPPGGRECQLPHKEILALKDLVKRGNLVAL